MNAQSSRFTSALPTRLPRTRNPTNATCGSGSPEAQQVGDDAIPFRREDRFRMKLQPDLPGRKVAHCHDQPVSGANGIDAEPGRNVGRR